MGERWEEIRDEIACQIEGRLREHRAGLYTTRALEIACKRIAALETERDEARRKAIDDVVRCLSAASSGVIAALKDRLRRLKGKGASDG